MLVESESPWVWPRTTFTLSWKEANSALLDGAQSTCVMADAGPISAWV